MDDIVGMFFHNDNEDIALAEARCLEYFGKDTLEECVEQVNERFVHYQNFVNWYGEALWRGCICVTMNDLCKACYIRSIEQEFTTLQRLKNQNSVELTDMERQSYDEIVRECNIRGIELNEIHQ